MKFFSLSDRGARHRLNSLVGKGFVVKEQKSFENGLKWVYSANIDLINKKLLGNVKK